ncbi:Proteophosphoglycan, putative [Trypanosoma equiperdum]|uniref:Uncharacterized protein n=2 Tax=Trypanozoon TaxID=39700 RepID=Q38B16_TRYB2|nr:hypothetical protein Tb10.70.1030 [Trypanosoma brucei brucei TREU927]EAN78004.1 hypothetical protein Tb10.70.1030 [Trypanosoma brucei brucei TREU927]SCU68402.1 Proteophosphoglycan, putative [Trypanosoma equiperdum]
MLQSKVVGAQARGAGAQPYQAVNGNLDKHNNPMSLSLKEHKRRLRSLLHPSHSGSSDSSYPAASKFSLPDRSAQASVRPSPRIRSYRMQTGNTVSPVNSSTPSAVRRQRSNISSTCLTPGRCSPRRALGGKRRPPEDTFNTFATYDRVLQFTLLHSGRFHSKTTNGDSAEQESTATRSQQDSQQLSAISKTPKDQATPPEQPVLHRARSVFVDRPLNGTEDAAVPGLRSFISTMATPRPEGGQAPLFSARGRYFKSPVRTRGGNAPKSGDAAETEDVVPATIVFKLDAALAKLCESKEAEVMREENGAPMGQEGTSLNGVDGEFCQKHSYHDSRSEDLSCSAVGGALRPGENGVAFDGKLGAVERNSLRKVVSSGSHLKSALKPPKADITRSQVLSSDGSCLTPANSLADIPSAAKNLPSPTTVRPRPRQLKLPSTLVDSKASVSEEANNVSSDRPVGKLVRFSDAENIGHAIMKESPRTPLRRGVGRSTLPATPSQKMTPKTRRRDKLLPTQDYTEGQLICVSSSRRKKSGHTVQKGGLVSSTEASAVTKVKTLPSGNGEVKPTEDVTSKVVSDFNQVEKVTPDGGKGSNITSSRKSASLDSSVTAKSSIQLGVAPTNEQAPTES